MADCCRACVICRGGCVDEEQQRACHCIGKAADVLLWCTCRGPYGMQDPNFLANGLLGGSLNSLGANALADLALTQVCSPST